MWPRNNQEKPGLHIVASRMRVPHEKVASCPRIRIEHERTDFNPNVRPGKAVSRQRRLHGRYGEDECRHEQGHTTIRKMAEKGMNEEKKDQKMLREWLAKHGG